MEVKKEVEKKMIQYQKKKQQKNFINQLKSEGKAIFNSNRTKQTWMKLNQNIQIGQLYSTK